MWNTIHDSVRGASHERLGMPCQDAHRVDVVPSDDGQVLLLVCADGAGSARESERGATVVCDRFIARAKEHVQNVPDLSELTRDVMIGWINDVREELTLEATSQGLTLRDYAATLLAAVVGPESAVFVQIGDGAIVVGSHEEYCTVFWPQSGEFANTTNFITDDAFEEKLEWAVMPDTIVDVACFTDGLERLALRFDTREVHGPFLSPMLSALRHHKNPDELFASLSEFLNSEKVNERTDDDKTLILATRIENVE